MSEEPGIDMPTTMNEDGTLEFRLTGLEKYQGVVPLRDFCKFGIALVKALDAVERSITGKRRTEVEYMLVGVKSVRPLTVKIQAIDKTNPDLRVKEIPSDDHEPTPADRGEGDD